jgi:hypothetical protein
MPLDRGAEGVVEAAGSGVIGATSRIVAEYPRPQFWQISEISVFFSFAGLVPDIS